MMTESLNTGGRISIPSMLTKDVRILQRTKEAAGTIKVAAYCRVSTDKEIQQNSLETQVASYNRIISEHPGWVLAGIYADKGISGTSVKHREEFKRMIEDAKGGRIQYILAKSISRFARNTVDALAYIRQLKSYGVSVYFEREKLDTGSAVSEFLLSIFAASAQEEIISLSNNMKVGRRMRSAAGIVQWTHVYGYRCIEGGQWAIEPNEAEVVRRIFEEYASGRSLPEICKGLEADGIPSTGNKSNWIATSVADILHNEKYVGDVLMQKTYISDPIQHTRVDNRDAKLKQYYRSNHHEAIVSRELYEMAQAILTMKNRHRGISQYPYYGFLKCPLCGENMVRCQLYLSDVHYVWTCGGKDGETGCLRKERSACPPYYFPEEYINRAFKLALHQVNKNELKRIASCSDAEKAAAAQAMLRYIEQRGHKTIEYKELMDTIQKVSFPMWHIMKVDWKCGLTSTVSMEFKRVCHHPYPTITKVEKEGDNPEDEESKTRITYLVNGKPLTKGNCELQVQGIMTAREAVLNTVILQALPFEPPIPRVIGIKSTALPGQTQMQAKEE